MKNPLNLSSVDAKFRRAEHHAKAVEDAIRCWGGNDPCSISYKTNADSTRYSAILNIRKPAPIEDWSLAIADSIHNFRCALDHLVYAVATCESPSDPPPHADTLMFPIRDTDIGFDRDIQKWRLGKISVPVQAVIKAFQPYNRPYPKLPPLLAMLRDFDNANKHKLLQLVYTAIAQGQVSLIGPSSAATTATRLANQGELEDGAEVAAYVFDRPTPDMQFQGVKVMIVFALTHKKGIGAATDRDDCISLMGLIGKEIREVISEVQKVI